MPTQTGSTYISESMKDIVKIPTANLGFRPTRARGLSGLHLTRNKFDIFLGKRLGAFYPHTQQVRVK